MSAAGEAAPRTGPARPGTEKVTPSAAPRHAVPQQRSWLAQIQPYRPGRPAGTRDGSMASNENPLGPSQSALTAAHRSLATMHRYPQPLADDLRLRLAEFHRVTPDQILVGNGSDELIFLLALAYLAGGGVAACADPPYQMDAISSLVVGGAVIRVPLQDWRHDLGSMARTRADLLYVCNPHNPTGTTHSATRIEQLVDQTADQSLVVVDEAYIDFVDDVEATSAIRLAADGRAVVLRTFSKIYALAGLRIGYLVAHRDVVAVLRSVRAPFSVNQIAQRTAVAAIADRAHWSRAREYVRVGRQRLTQMLDEAGYAVVPSQANFVLALVPDEEHFVEHLARYGVSVRPGSVLGVPGAVRITVPSEPGFDLLAAALAEIRWNDRRG